MILALTYLAVTFFAKFLEHCDLSFKAIQLSLLIL